MTGLDTSSFEALEKSGWQDPATAASYAGGFAEAAQHCVAPMVAIAGAGPGRRVLDLCCGHGNVTEALVESGAAVTALDFSPAMLDMAQKRAPGAEFVEGNAMDLPFEADSFDAVTIGFGLLHVPDPLRTLAEVRRVLRPGGTLAYSVWHAPTIPTAVGYVFAAIGEHGDANVQLPPGPGLHDYADPEIAGPGLTKSGFGSVEMQVVDSYWTSDRPDAPVDFFLEGTVRGAALLRAQPPGKLDAIRAAVSAQVTASHGPSAPWRIPIPAVIVSAKAV